MLVTLIVFQEPIVWLNPIFWLNAVAFWNMLLMLVTAVVFQLEMLPSKESAPENIEFMAVTLAVLQLFSD